MPRPLDRNVYRLGALSLFNDFTNDMITPLLPAFLATMGMGSVALGAVEGIANCLCYVTMLFAGFYVDRHGRHKKITLFGYSLCAFSRPLLAIPLFPDTLLIRSVDRIGKGIRTAPRDAFLTSLVPKKDWGRAFGVQRAMDHAGAVLGTPLAVWLLYEYHLSLPLLFLVACIPSIVSVFFFPRKIPETSAKRGLLTDKTSLKSLPSSMRPYLWVIFFSAATTPSELFFFLKMQAMGLKVYFMPVAWLVLTLFTLFSSYLGGLLSDRWSRRATMGVGWFIFSIVYVGFAYNQRLIFSWILLAFYGLQAGIVEAAERSYPAQLADEKNRATVLGWYYFAYGMGLLPASLVFGILWKNWNPQGAFLLYAGLTFVCVFLLKLLPASRPDHPIFPSVSAEGERID